MTVEEIFEEYTKLVPEERTKFLTKINSWLISKVEERNRLEAEKKLNVGDKSK